MSIKQFIQQQVFLPRLQQASVLVVYDPDKRYRELCLELAGDGRAVVDAGESSIESRAAALAALQALGRANGSLKELLVYVPAPPPLTDEDRQRDPFAIYGACGAVFPSGDGDTYQSLCLRARPDQATAIYRIFAANPNPTFAMIDAVGGGPRLAAAAGAAARGVGARPALCPARPHAAAGTGAQRPGGLGRRGQVAARRDARAAPRDPRQDAGSYRRRAVALPAL